MVSMLNFGYPDPALAPRYEFPIGGGLSGHLVDVDTVRGRDAIDAFNKVGLLWVESYDGDNGRVHAIFRGIRKGPSSDPKYDSRFDGELSRLSREYAVQRGFIAPSDGWVFRPWVELAEAREGQQEFEDITLVRGLHPDARYDHLALVCDPEYGTWPVDERTRGTVEEHLDDLAFRLRSRIRFLND